MANLTTLARPYAKAILQLAKQANTYTQWTAALDFLANLAIDPIGKKLLMNCTVSAKQKAEFICSLAPDLLSSEAQNLVKLLAASKRLLLLPELFRLYTAMRNKELGAVTVHLTLAQPAEVNIANLSKNFTLIETVDPSLIGGGIAKIGNRVVDASVMGRLIALRDQLRQ